jgi:hypothetical protein
VAVTLASGFGAVGEDRISHPSLLPARFAELPKPFQTTVAEDTQTV